MNDSRVFVEEILSLDPVEEKGEYFHNFLNKVLDKKDIILKSVEKYGTPQYILDEKELRKRAISFKNSFQSNISNVEFFYAFKCNDLPYLARILKEEGFNADVASILELKLALKLGFEKIILSGPGKSKEELELAVDNDVMINIDNLDELERVIGIKKKVRVCFRVDSDSEIGGNWSKFGIKLGDLKKAMDLARMAGCIEVAGIHFHCSYNRTPEKYVENLKLIGDYIKQNFLEEDLSDLSFIDIGGGFYPEGEGILFSESIKGRLIDLIEEHSDVKTEFNSEKIYRDEPVDLKVFSEEIAKQLKAIKENDPRLKNVKLILEPGRYITSHSTSIIFKVMSKKPNGVVVDGGMNLTGDFRFLTDFLPILNISKPSLKMKKCTVFGSLCDPSDIWGYSVFGEGCEKEDILVLLHQGAYTFSGAWRFIKPGAPYVVIDKNNDLKLVKKEETFEDRYSGCEL
jgi:diaminopimelate decarboxylase